MLRGRFRVCVLSRLPEPLDEGTHAVGIQESTVQNHPRPDFSAVDHRAQPLIKECRLKRVVPKSELALAERRPVAVVHDQVRGCTNRGSQSPVRGSMMCSWWFLSTQGICLGPAWCCYTGRGRLEISFYLDPPPVGKGRILSPQTVRKTSADGH